MTLKENKLLSWKWLTFSLCRQGRNKITTCGEKKKHHWPRAVGPNYTLGTDKYDWIMVRYLMPET